MACGACMALAGDQQAPAISKAEAERELNRMKSSLRGWLKYRNINDEVAAGKRKAKVPPGIFKRRLFRNRDWAGEQNLAEDMYLLLSKVYSPGQLPRPDIQRDPLAAVKLANIVISGKLLDQVQVSQPQATGIVWFIPAIVGGVLLMGWSTKVKSDADVQKHKELMECVAAGACMDPNAWKTYAAVAALGIAGIFIWVNYGDKITAKLGGKKKRKR